MYKCSMILLAVCGLIVLGGSCALAGTLTGYDIAPAGTAGANVIQGSPTCLNDLTYLTQLDATSYAGITWTSAQTFNAVDLQQTLDYQVQGFDLQVAKQGVTNPNLAIDSDWYTPTGWSFTGSTNDNTLVSGSNITSYGVRVKGTNFQSPSGLNDHLRLKELMVLQNYSGNASLTATVGGTAGWAAPSFITDGSFGTQGFIDTLTPAPLTFTWAQPQTIGAVVVQGGYSGELAKAYTVDYSTDGGVSWHNAVTVSDNSTSIKWSDFGSPITASEFRVTFTDSSPDNYTRVGEIQFLTYTPEPSTLVLLATGLISLLAYAWRKRK